MDHEEFPQEPIFETDNYVCFIGRMPGEYDLNQYVVTYKPHDVVQFACPNHVQAIEWMKEMEKVLIQFEKDEDDPQEEFEFELDDDEEEEEEDVEPTGLN